MGIINYLKLFVPRELNDDIYNSQSKDCNQWEKFFTNIDIFHEYKFANFTFTEFENVFNREYDEYIRLLKKARFFMLTYTDIDKLKSIKAKLYSLEKLGIKHFGEQKCLKKIKYLSFNILNSKLSKCKSNNLDDLIKYELDNINTKFDKFNLLVYIYNSNKEKYEVNNSWDVIFKRNIIKDNNKFNIYKYKIFVQKQFQKSLKLIDNNNYLIFSWFCNLFESLPDWFWDILDENYITKIYLNNLKIINTKIYNKSLKWLKMDALEFLPECFFDGFKIRNLIGISLNWLKELPIWFFEWIKKAKIQVLYLDWIDQLSSNINRKDTDIRELSLNGLKQLPEWFFDSINNSKIKTLSLNGLNILPQNINLNNLDINILSLNGLSQLPNDFIFTGNVTTLSLNWLTKLQSKFSLNLWYWCNLYLDGLNQIPDYFFKSLNNSEINILSLNNLRQLPEWFINGLESKCIIDLYLNGISTLPEKIDFSNTYINSLHLDNLEYLPEWFFEGFKESKVMFLSLNWIKQFPENIESSWISIIELHINGIKYLSNWIINFLNNNNISWLSLNGIDKLSIWFINLIKKYEFQWLYLNNLKELNSNIFKTIKCEVLLLDGINEFSDELNFRNVKIEDISLDGLRIINEQFINHIKESWIRYISINNLKQIIKDDSILNKERNALVNFVNEYNSGACLLSGYRWVGKTSLIKESINHYKAANEDENVVEIIINVPEVDKDKKWFDKTQLINRLVVAMYEKIYPNPHIPSKFKKQIFQQYLRVYNEIENKSTSSLTREWTKYIINTKAVVLLIIWLVVVFSFYKLDVSIIKSLFSWLIGTVSLNFVYSFFVKKYTEKQTIERTMKEIYNADIAETRIIQNIGNVVNWFSFNYLRRKIERLICDFVSNIIKYIKKHYYLLFIYIILLIGLIGLLNLLMQYWLWFCTFPETFLNNQNIFISFFTQSIKIINDNDLVRLVIASILWIILIKTIKSLFYKPTKFIFVIDELDKLLDFEKNKWNMKQWESKDNLDMKQVFEVLSKLKTLFFDTRWAIFFIVTNKEAYDYYITHKHQEDDIVSNIFNKVIYLPMNSLSNFNINYLVDVQENEETKKKENADDVESNLVSKTKDIRQTIQKFLYFKSHGNWRKSKFILSNMMNNNIIQLNEDEVNFDMQFYDFFYKLYQIFLSDSLDKFAEFDLFQEFLFGLWENKWYIGRMYDDKYNETVYCPTIEEVKIQKSKNIAEALTNSNEPYYFKYLLDIKEQVKLISWLDGNTLNDLSVMENIKFLITRFQWWDINKRDFFGLYVASIHRVNSEYAYRDYILNTLLNMFENIKFHRKISLNELFKVVRINKDDLQYPAFTDLLVFWLPLMLFYFASNKFNDQ